MSHPIEVVMIECVAGISLGIDDCLIALAVSADNDIRHSSLLTDMLCLEPEDVSENSFRCLLKFRSLLSTIKSHLIIVTVES